MSSIKQTYAGELEYICILCLKSVHSGLNSFSSSTNSFAVIGLSLLYILSIASRWCLNNCIHQVPLIYMVVIFLKSTTNVNLLTAMLSHKSIPCKGFVKKILKNLATSNLPRFETFLRCRDCGKTISVGGSYSTVLEVQWKKRLSTWKSTTLFMTDSGRGK